MASTPSPVPRPGTWRARWPPTQRGRGCAASSSFRRGSSPAKSGRRAPTGRPSSRSRVRMTTSTGCAPSDRTGTGGRSSTSTCAPSIRRAARRWRSRSWSNSAGGRRTTSWYPSRLGRCSAKTAKAFQELVGVGLLDQVGTRIHAAQAQGCAPVSTAVQQGLDRITPVRPNSIAKSLAIGNPADGRYAARAVRASGGWAPACREDAVQEGMALLAETEGILSEPAGGVVVAGLQELVAQGRIQRKETVVICITGNGLKTTELFDVRDGHRLHLARPRASEFEEALAAAQKAPAAVA